MWHYLVNFGASHWFKLSGTKAGHCTSSSSSAKCLLTRYKNNPILLTRGGPILMVLVSGSQSGLATAAVALEESCKWKVWCEDSVGCFPFSVKRGRLYWRNRQFLVSSPWYWFALREKCIHNMCLFKRACAPVSAPTRMSTSSSY